MAHGSRGNDDSMMPDPPATMMRGQMNKSEMPNPPGPVAEALAQISRMEMQLEEMRKNLMRQQNRR